jgi:glycosyltransferase involved in cell wall biosynthesis
LYSTQSTTSKVGQLGKHPNLVSMKLLFIVPEYLELGGEGIASFYGAILPRFVSRGHEVSVICGSGLSSTPRQQAFQKGGVSIETLGTDRLNAWLPRFQCLAAFPAVQRHLAAAWAMWETAGAGPKFDVVEATDWGLLYLPWLLHADIPVLVQMHGSIGQIACHDPFVGEEVMGILVQLLENESLRHAAIIQTYSPANVAFWSARLRRPVQMIYPALASKHPLTGIDRIAGQGIVVGRIQRWKGPDILCEALRLLGRSAPPIKWIGRDTAFERVGSSTAAMLASRFPEVWGSKLAPIGVRSACETRRLQQRAGFSIVPSRWDVFNLSCVEAMSCGTPVICSDAAGSSALISNRENGYVFKSGIPESLATAIDNLLASPPGQLREIGEAGRDTVKRMLEPELIADQRLTEYEAAAAECKARGAPSSVDWIPELLMLSRDPAISKMAFLDHLPIRGIATYLAQRVTNKLCSRL